MQQLLKIQAFKYQEQFLKIQDKYQHECLLLKDKEVVAK